MNRTAWRSRASNGFASLLRQPQRDIEKRLSTIYTEAIKGLQGEINAYFASFQARDLIEQGRVAAGEITEAAYKQWRLTQLGRGQRFRDLQSKIATSMARVNQRAAAIANDGAVHTYALSHDYQAYNIATAAGEVFENADWNLVNERAVKELINGGNHVNFKVLNPNRVRDYNWNADRIQATLTREILMGSGTKQIAAAFLQTMGNNEVAAIRNARTAATSAAGAGNQLAAEEAEEMGLKVMKEWVAAIDDRTRESHEALNGVRVPVDQPFPNGLMYPGDPHGAPGEVYNCRCTMITVVEGMEVKQQPVKGFDKWQKQQDVAPEPQPEQVPANETARAKIKEYDERVSALETRSRELDDEYQKANIELFEHLDEFDKYNAKLEDINQEAARVNAELGKAMEERTAYFKSAGEDAVLAEFGRIEGPHSMRDDALRVNDFDLNDQNCNRCVLAYDARRRGIDCMAESGAGLPTTVIAEHWVGGKFTSCGSYDPIDAMKEISRAAESWGEGARGVVEVEWAKAPTGHVFNFEVVDGKNIFVDAQLGLVYIDGAESKFERVKPGTVSYLRTDDKEIAIQALGYAQKFDPDKFTEFGKERFKMGK